MRKDFYQNMLYTFLRKKALGDITSMTKTLVTAFK